MGWNFNMARKQIIFYSLYLIYSKEKKKKNLL